MLDFIILYSLHALYMWLSLILWLTVVHVTEMFWLLDSIVPWIYSLLLYKHDDTFKQLFRVRLLGHFWLILKMISIVKCALLERKACCYVANAFFVEIGANFASMSNTPKLSRFAWGTLRFDSICTLRLDSIRTESRLTNQLPAWWIDNGGNDWIRSNRVESTTFSTHPA